MTIEDLLAANHVHLDLRTSGKPQLLRALAVLAAKTCPIGADAILAAIEHREALGSTGVGKGLAMPHARLAGLTAPIMLFVRLKSPIKFDAIDDQPVDCVAFVLLPERTDDINVLACIARPLRDHAVLDQIRAAHDPEQVIKVLQVTDVRRPA